MLRWSVRYWKGAWQQYLRQLHMRRQIRKKITEAQEQRRIKAKLIALKGRKDSLALRATERQIDAKEAKYGKV